MLHQCSSDCDQSTANLQAKQKQLAIALLLVSSFAIVEFLIGLTSGSLSLVAESGHMASDSLALVLALVASWATQISKPDALSDSLMTIAPRQTWETWAALINGVGLLGLAGWVVWEALQRFQQPLVEIASIPMLVTAGLGLVVNSINIAILHRGSEHDLNLRAAFLHVLADAVGSVGVILAAIAVSQFDWFWADAVISLFVAMLVSVSAIPLIFQTSKCLFLARPLTEIGDR